MRHGHRVAVGAPVGGDGGEVHFVPVGRAADAVNTHVVRERPAGVVLAAGAGADDAVEARGEDFQLDEGGVGRRRGEGNGGVLRGRAP